MVVSSAQKTVTETKTRQVPITKGPMAGRGMKKEQYQEQKTVETRTVGSAGYALAWYLRNDELP